MNTLSNSSAVSALRLLQGTNRELGVTGRRIVSGLAVAEAKDDPSRWRTATTLRSEAKSLAGVQAILATGMAGVATAGAALSGTRTILGEMKALLTSAKASGADLGAVQSQIAALAAQLRSTASTASFAGLNLVSVNTDAANYTPQASLVSAATAGPSGAPRFGTVSLDTRFTRLFDGGGAASGILQKPFDLPTLALGGAGGTAPNTAGLAGTASETPGKAGSTPALAGLSGTATATNGLDAVAPAATGLSGTASAVAGVTGAAPATAGLSGAASAQITGKAEFAGRSAELILGKLNPAAYGIGDRVELDVKLGTETRTITISFTTLTEGNVQTTLQAALNAKFGPDKLIAKVAADKTISIATVAPGATLRVDRIQALDGNLVAGKLGFTDADTLNYSIYTNEGVKNGDLLGQFTLDGIDQTDRLKLTIKGEYKDANNVTIYNTTQITVDTKTTSISDFNDKLWRALGEQRPQELNGASAQSLYGVESARYGNKVHLYSMKDGGKVEVTVEAIDGDGTTLASTGLLTGSATGSNPEAGRAASVRTGSDFAGPITVQDGAALGFDLAVNGVATNIRITRQMVDAAQLAYRGAVDGNGTIGDAAEFAFVVQSALRDKGINNVAVAADGARLKFTRTGTPADGDALALSNVTATAGTSRAATLTTGSNFAGPVTIASNASLDFDLKLDGGAARAIRITRADVDAALTGRAGYAAGSGTIADAAALALVVQSALGRAGVAGLAVSASGSRLVFTKTTAGAGSIAIANAAGRATATRASAVTGSDFAGPVTLEDGAAIGFTLAVNGAAAQTIRIERSTVEAALAGTAGYAPGSGRIDTAAQLAAVANQALAGKGLGLTVAATGNRLAFTRDAAGAGSVAVGNAFAVASAATAAVSRGGSDFAGPLTIGESASISFDIALDDGAARTVRITRSMVDAALAAESGYAAGSGRIADAAQFARVVGRALSEGGLSGILVSADANRLVFTKAAAGAGRIAVGNASSSEGAGFLDVTDVTVERINIGGEGFSRLGSAQRQAVIDALIAGVDETTTNVVKAEAYLGSVTRRLEIQTSFLTGLQDIMSTRLNDLVKADIPEETARLKALEVRQQLALQALQILNQSQQNILQLFKKQD